VPIVEVGDEAYGRWRATNVRAQKQFGFVMAVASVPLGDVTSDQMRVLGELASAYGDGTIRVTPDQDLVFRWVNVCDLRQLYRRLAAAGLGLAEGGTVADVTSCPGAESCRLAVTQSRGLGRLLEDQLRARPDLIAAADGARIKISGCPNGCGLHHIATFGFRAACGGSGRARCRSALVSIGGGTRSKWRSASRCEDPAPHSGSRGAVDQLCAPAPAGRVGDGVLRQRGSRRS
jgi:sulfite reductase beta subunit-like hemoprotein